MAPMVTKIAHNRALTRTFSAAPTYASGHRYNPDGRLRKPFETTPSQAHSSQRIDPAVPPFGQRFDRFVGRET